MKKLIKNDQVELSSYLIRNNSKVSYQNVPINKNDLILVELLIPKQSEENKLSLIKLKISTTGAESGFKFKVHNQPYITNETELYDYISQLNDDDVVATYSKETASDEYIDLTKVTFNDSGTKLSTNLIIENNYDISNNPNDFCITSFGQGVDLKIYVNNISGIRKDNPLLAFNISEDSTIYVNLLTGKEIGIRNFNDGINNYNIMGCFKWDASNQGVGLNYEFNNKYQIINDDLVENTNLNKNSPYVIIKDYTSTEHYYSFLERKTFEQEIIFGITEETDANVFYNEEDHSLLIKLCGFYHILYPDDSRIIMEKRGEYLYVKELFNNYLDKTVYEYENNDIVRISSVDGEITFRKEDDEKLRIYFSKTNKYMYASMSGITWPIDNECTNIPELKEYFSEYQERLYSVENYKTNQTLKLEYTDGKVSRVKIANGELSDGVFSTNLVINYYNNYTEVTDIINSKKMFYYFDNEGRIKEIVSDTSKRKSLVYTGNNLTKSVIQKEYAKEEIKNGSFESNLDHWFNASNVSVVDGVISNKCLKANSGASLTQTITLEQGKKYKICGSVKFEDITESANNVIVIEASYYTHQTENNEIVQNPIYKWFDLGVVLDGTKRGWHNFSSNEVTLPTDAYDINAILNIYVEDTLYLDEIRLNEKKNTTYNLFENGNLENITQNMPDGFITENLDETDTIVEDPIYHLHPKEVGKHAFKISGIDFFNQKVKKIKKVLQISGSKNDIFTASVLVKANTNSNELSRLYILVNYLHFEKVYYFDASNHLNIYQKVFGSFIAEDDFTSVEIGYEYNGTSTLLLDGFELYKDLSATQSMFSNDNLVSTGNVSKPTTLQYSKDYFLTKIINSDGLYKELTYLWGNIIKEEDIYGNIIEYDYDNKNRLEEKKITSYKGEVITESYVYDISEEDNNEFIVYTDPFGKQSRMYKNKAGLISKKIYPNNLNILYEYEENDNIYSIRALSDGTELSKNDLRYIHDDIMSSATLNNGTYYNFTYNDYYDLTSVSTVTGKIETYEYDTANPNLLKKLNYKFGLDETINEVVPIGYYEYIYDEENNLSKILRYENNLLKEEKIITYDINGNIYSTQTGNETTYFIYDASGRLIKQIDQDENITQYKYDKLGNVCKKDYGNRLSVDVYYDNNEANQTLDRKTYLNRLIDNYDSDIIIGSNYISGMYGLTSEVVDVNYFKDTQMNSKVINLTEIGKYPQYDLNTVNINKDNTLKNNEVFSKTSFDEEFKYNKTLYTFIKPLSKYNETDIFTFINKEENIFVEKLSLTLNNTGSLELKQGSTILYTTTNKVLLNSWNMVALRIYANENKTKYNYFICINSAKENVENNTDIFESTKLMLGRKTLDYVDGSLDINTSTTRQMPLRIMLLGVDAYNHTEETLNEIYQLGRSSLQVPFLDKSQSVSFNLNNKKYKASNKIDELGRISRKEFTVDNVTKFYKNYTYNKTRPTEEVEKNSLITTYTYDDMGNIITKSNINKSYAYGYDSLNRLVSEQTNDYTINYFYNSNGNMYRKTVIKGNETTNYTYRYSSNSLIKITKEVNGEVVNEDNITYNKLYPIKINNVDYEWDNNNLIRIGTNTYEYNSSNIRTKKTVGTKVYTYTLDNTNIIKEHILDTTNNIDVTLEYIYDANNTLVGVIENENIYYYDRDITGLILGLVDINGNYVVKYTYTAYGEVEKDILVNTNISTYNPFMYKGYYYDVETKVYYCNSRYYSPELCRWISPDSIEYLDPESINGLNLYYYCGNDPINRYDPSGHFWDYVIDAVFIVWGIYDLVNGGYKDWKNWVALGVDIAFAVLPYVPSGAGQVIKVGNKIDNAIDVASAINKIDNIQDMSKVTMIGRSMDRVTDTAKLIGKADNLYDVWKGYDATATGFKKIAHDGISMLHDAGWMLGKLRSGYTVIDIGMTTLHKGRGLYYGAERFVIGLWKTRNLWKLPINYYF